MKYFKYILTLIILFALNTTSFEQENVRIKRKEFFKKKEGFKEAWKNVKLGDDSYEFGSATYRDARTKYLKAIKYNDKNAALNYKIGICYLYADDKFQAIKYLKKAFELKPDVTEDIHYQLARAYHMSMDFDNAIKEYQKFKTTVKPKKLEKMNVDLEKLMNDCETGKSLVGNPVRVVVQGLGKSVNSEFDDYRAVVDPKEESMYFTSRRPTNKGAKRFFGDKKFFENSLLSKKKGKDWGNAIQLDQTFNSSSNDAILAMSPDGKRLYVYKGKKGNGDIYYSEFKDGKWKGLKSFSVINRGDSRETSMSITQDGKKIYFVSDREKGSVAEAGSKDIWVVEMDAKGKWSKPRNLGTTVNTKDNEEAVCISADGKTIYFSSKGHAGMGGYDIFSSTLSDNGKWSKPVNMGYPINSPDDDLFFNMMQNGKSAYLTSIREQGIGEKDIYKVIFLGAEKELTNSFITTPLAYELYDTKSMFKRIPDFLDIDTSIIVTGRVLDSETKMPIIAKLQFIDSQKGQIASVLVTDSTGVFKAKMAERKPYGVEISAKGYLFFLDVVDLSKVTDVLNKDFYLQQLEVGAKVVLKQIFFETGKSTLKEESFQQLNNVIEFMKVNPTLKLEISGHTDNVGGLTANIKLSEARAKAVVEYMVKNGIDKSRLQFKGYGPNQPVAPNNTNDGRAQNRRVEFKITGK